MTTPGLRLGVTSAEYHGGPGVSKSGLDAIHRSPAHFQAYTAQALADTPDMRLGRLAHVAVLEPDAFDAQTALAPDVDRRAKAGREAWEEFTAAHAGLEIVTTAERCMLFAWRDAVWQHTMARHLISLPGPVEASAYAYDEGATGLLRKCRPDKLLPELGIVVDLKTTKDASPEAFSKAVYNYRYHVQAAYYMDTLALAGVRADAFVFVAVEKSAPFAVGVYSLEPEAIELGRTVYRRDLDKLSECIISGRWPGYTEDIVSIGLPRWAYKKEDTTE